MTASQYKYLDCIDSLCKQNENFNMASIAVKLGVSRVSSYRAMEKLRVNKLIDTTKEGKWYLTEKGKEKLEEVRNGIRFLQEVLENDERNVEDEVDIKMKIKLLLEKMKEVLKDREKTILELRFGLGGHKPKTQHEIASMMGISRSYVSRIETKAINKLSKEIKE